MRAFMRNRFGALLSMALLLSGTAGSQAGELTEPDRLFEAQGVMSFVDLAARQVVIDKRSYRLAANAVWYGIDPDLSLQQQLLTAFNREVGYEVDSSVHQPAVKAIWILPDLSR